MRPPRLVLAILFGATACATAKLPAAKVEASEPGPPPYAVVAQDSAPPPTFTDGNACERWARRLLPDEQRALQGLRSCLSKSGFNRIRPLLAEPWASVLARRPDGHHLLAQLIAARGTVDADLKTLSKRGGAVLLLDVAANNPGLNLGRWIVALCRVSVAKRERTGEVELQLEEVRFEVASTGGYSWRRNSDILHRPTGRKLTLAVAGKGPYNPGAVVVVSGRFKKPRNTALSPTDTPDWRYDLEDPRVFAAVPYNSVLLED